MLLKKKTPQNESELLGAVRISDSSFFVFKDTMGKVSIKSGCEEKQHHHILMKMVEKNPQVKRVLNRYKLKPIINTKTLKNLTSGHMNDTCKVATAIYSILSKNLKVGIDYDTIKEASILHDIGKVFIPSKILNKPTKLNRKEREIMNIHSILGYELLKTQNIKEDILELVKYHHQNLNQTGYPTIAGEHFPSCIGVQIISTADKYSALRESRIYRHSLSKIEALTILYEEVLSGKILKDVFNALVIYAKDYESDPA